MPLPIALGGKSVSAQSLPGPCCHPGQSDDGTILAPVELYQSLAWGVCPKNEWLVRVTTSYYDLLHPSSGNIETTMVEVRIQISPLNRPLSPNYRETSHHMKLLEGRAPQEEYPQSQPAVCVSEDRRSLAVLLCHPHLKTSALAIFQLRTPRTDLSSPYSPIPLPSYCAATSSNDNSSSVFSRDAPVVATHPRFVSIWGISTMCSIPNVSPPILLVACHDGSLVWLDFRSSMAVATGYLTVPDPEKHLPLSSIVAAPTCGINSGTLLALSPEGCMLLVKWQLESTTPMQHALLKRASTGGILLNTPTSNKSPPRRYHSSGGEGGDDGLKQLSPIRIFGRTAGKIDYSRLGLPLFGNSEIEKEESEKRMQHMNQFVLRELQKKTLAGNWMVRKNHHPTKARARRRSDIGLCRNNSMKRSMLVEVLSTLEEPVVDARFGMMPTVVCVVYEATSQTRRVAEIFTISELGSFQPIVALSLAPEQVESAVSVYNHRNDMAARPIERRTSVESRFGVTHDASSDSFAINTMYDNQWIGCVWNWRANVLGWTIQNPVKDFLWSRLYFGNHPHEGCHLAYVETTQNKYIQTRKQVVATGLLSPANTYISALEPCSLLLSFDSVSFPDSSQHTSDDVLELEWKVSTLPSTYLNSYGVPRIAAVGRQNGSSLAVASSYGVCILDNKYKWKQFGTPNEEKTFGILAMTWWEGTMDGETEEETEDLLVAIIQSNNGRQYLSCWSPKRLDLAHQLLESHDPWESNEETNLNSPWGIPLAKGIKATDLSLLAEPKTYTTSTDKPRRAVAIVSSPNMETGEMEYATFQLQMSKRCNSGDAKTYEEQKPYNVLVKPSVHGTLKNGARSIGPISSSFVAGASFRFDLEKFGSESEEEFVVTLGLVRTPGGMEAISLSSDGKAWIAAVVDADEVSKHWLADVVCASDLVPECPHPFDAFVWVIELMNGGLFCWSVPYLLYGDHYNDANDFQLSVFFQDATISRPKGLYPPTLICKKETREAKRRFLLGVLCHVGSSSDWMAQSSAGCQTDIAMGHVPQSLFGCVLRAGQEARKLHRESVEFDTDIFASDFLESDVYGPSDFMMMPPAFVPPLYSMFLEAAHLRTIIPVMEESKLDATSTMLQEESDRLETIEKHVLFRLQRSPNKDAVLMALRLLIIRSVEMLSNADRKHRKAQSDVTHSVLLLTMALFSEVVDTVRRCTSNLQFASLFLEVGRQIEPSCLAHLFPLPLPGKKSEHVHEKQALTKSSVRSVLELFSLCIEAGSLAASASALPLLASRMQSRNYCDLLLARSIEAFVKNTDSGECTFDFTEEERRVIGDIFRFGMKLEDAAKIEAQLEKQDSEAEASKHDEVQASFTTDTMDSNSSTPNQASRNLICMSSRQGSILNYVMPSVFNDEKAEEEAISRAATSFIENNSDFRSLDFLALGDDEERELGEDSVSGPDSILKSVGGLVGDTLLELLRSPKTDCPWKTMFSLARLLIQGENQAASTSEVFVKAVDNAKIQHFDSLVPDCYAGGDDMERLVRFIVVDMAHSGHQLNVFEASLIVDLVLLLLQRLVDFPPEIHVNITAGLVAVALIAGHVSDRSPALMSTVDQDCFMYRIYERAVKDFESSA